MADLIASVRKVHAQVVGADASAPEPWRVSAIDPADGAVVRRHSRATLASPTANAPMLAGSGWSGGRRWCAAARGLPLTNPVGRLPVTTLLLLAFVWLLAPGEALGWRGFALPRPLTRGGGSAHRRGAC